MGLPSINIVFQTAGIEAIKKSEKGTVALILRDTVDYSSLTLYSVSDIPDDLSAASREYLELAFRGYVNPPRKILAYIIGADGGINDALIYFSSQSFDYLAGPPDLTEDEAEMIASWVKSERLNDHTAKAVLPNVAADHEGVINLTADGLQSGETMYTAAQYCGRVAGLIAGTPMTIACTFAPLRELSSVTHMTKQQLDEAIDSGEFTLFNDGEKIKVGRGVNSFVSTLQGKGAAFKKIKIVEAMDMIQNDIRTTAQDSYIGKYSNSYDNKCLLILAIKGYLEELEIGGILERGTSIVDIDVEAQENYLKKQGIDTSGMTEKQIKQANTGSFVFLRVTVSILDAIEDIVIRVTI